MTYVELERLYDRYVKEKETKLQDGTIILDDDDVESEEDECLRDRGFIYDVLQLKILTKLAEMNPDQYDFDLDLEFREVKVEVGFKYIGEAPKKRYDRLLAFCILLGKEYEYWRKILEKENKTIFKKPADIRHISETVLIWVQAALDVGKAEFAQELVDNAMEILLKYNGATPGIIQAYEYLHNKSRL